jgi:hypothetical protein
MLQLRVERGIESVGTVAIENNHLVQRGTYIRMR